MPVVIQLLFENYTVRQSMFIISGVYAHTFIGVGQGAPNFEILSVPDFESKHPSKALTPEVRKSKKKSNVKLTSIMNPSIVIYVIG